MICYKTKNCPLLHNYCMDTNFTETPTHPVKQQQTNRRMAKSAAFSSTTFTFSSDFNRLDRSVSVSLPKTSETVIDREKVFRSSVIRFVDFLITPCGIRYRGAAVPPGLYWLLILFNPNHLEMVLIHQKCLQ